MMKPGLYILGAACVLCGCSYESRMTDGGDIVIERIESYKDSVGTAPASLSDIGIAVVDEGNPPYYYQRIDSVHYTLSFSNGVGESKTYYSDSRKWEDFPRAINR
ncbi:MAG: hypothetical protein J6K95_08870 [Rikenellaceae bacterium]|nr:hypothetical protein [Rikenellaceae bacterium]